MCRGDTFLHSVVGLGFEGPLGRCLGYSAPRTHMLKVRLLQAQGLLEQRVLRKTWILALPERKGRGTRRTHTLGRYQARREYAWQTYLWVRRHFRRVFGWDKGCWSERRGDRAGDQCVRAKQGSRRKARMRKKSKKTTERRNNPATPVVYPGNRLCSGGSLIETQALGVQDGFQPTEPCLCFPCLYLSRTKPRRRDGRPPAAPHHSVTPSADLSGLRLATIILTVLGRTPSFSQTTSSPRPHKPGRDGTSSSPFASLGPNKTGPDATWP